MDPGFGIPDWFGFKRGIIPLSNPIERIQRSGFTGLDPTNLEASRWWSKTRREIRRLHDDPRPSLAHRAKDDGPSS